MNLTFLTEEQIFGEMQLEVFKKRGVAAEVTDFSRTIDPASNGSHLTIGKKTFGNYWSKSCNRRDKKVIICNSESSRDETDISSYKQYCRFVLPYSGDSSVCKYQNSYRCDDGVLEVEYGYYPQSMVSSDMQFMLEEAYQKGIIKKTGNYYTTGEHSWVPSRLVPKIHTEFEFQGNRYVRVIVPESFRSVYRLTLSDSESYSVGKYVWIEVEPVKWLVDEKESIMVTQKLLFAGLPYYIENTSFTSFEISDIKTFIDNYLSRDLFQKNDLNNNLLTISQKLDIILSSESNSKEQITVFLENLKRELETAIESTAYEQTDLELNAEVNIKIKKK